MSSMSMPFLKITHTKDSRFQSNDDRDLNGHVVVGRGRVHTTLVRLALEGHREAWHVQVLLLFYSLQLGI